MNSPQSGARDNRALLALADGSFFVGTPLGQINDIFNPTIGELVFNTSMTGYQEALTDPSYAGQLLCFSYPLIGNYGFKNESNESTGVHARACIVRESCTSPFDPGNGLNLNAFLADKGVPGIAGVDTRAIVRKIRQAGVMGAALACVQGPPTEIPDIAQALSLKAQAFDYSGTDFVTQVACKTQSVINPGAKRQVVLVDCGAKANISRELAARGLGVRIVPPTVTAQQILSSNPDGVMVSNGPGDPKNLTALISCLTELVGSEKTTIFGICLGHQLLAHALGAKTVKLKFGHRGSNHSVQEMESGRVFVTAQNHGFAVTDLPEDTVRPWFLNSYDGTNEGLMHKDLPVFSVQFHPEASPGPYDSKWLFDKFEGML